MASLFLSSRAASIVPVNSVSKKEIALGIDEQMDDDQLRRATREQLIAKVDPSMDNSYFE